MVQSRIATPSETLFAVQFPELFQPDFGDLNKTQANRGWWSRFSSREEWKECHGKNIFAKKGVIGGLDGAIFCTCPLKRVSFWFLPQQILNNYSKVSLSSLNLQKCPRNNSGHLQDTIFSLILAAMLPHSRGLYVASMVWCHLETTNSPQVCSLSGL